MHPACFAMSFSISDPVFLLIFTGIVSLAYVAVRKPFSHDPREPPLAPQSVPIIGHMIGLSQRKFDYYVDLRYYALTHWS